MLGDWDRDNLDGEEVDMVVDRVEVHPNFTDYQNDIGNTDKKTFLTDEILHLLTFHPFKLPPLLFLAIPNPVTTQPC